MAFSTLQRVGLGLLATGLLTNSTHAQTWQSVASQSTTNTPGTMTVLASTVDAAGNIVVAGAFTGLLQLGTLPALNSVGRGDLFVARLSPAGNWQQAVRAGGPDTDQVRALALAPNGDVIVAGQFASPTLVFGGITLTNAATTGTTDIFTVRLTPAGTWAAAAAAGGSGDEYVSGVGVDAAGVATVVGAFRSASLLIGSGTLTNAGPAALTASGTSADLFAAHLTGSTWSQAVRAGGPLDELAEAVAVTSAGEAVLVGSFSSPSVDFGTVTLANSVPAEQEPDAFVARLSPAGTWTQAVGAGAANGDLLTAVAVDAAGSVVVGGYFFGPTTAFGPVTLTNADATGNTSDVVVARLSAAGVWTQAVRGGSNGLDYLAGLRLDSQGNATVAGTFAGQSLALGTFNLANVSSGSSDIFTARLSAAGNWTHAAAAGGAGNDYATTVSNLGQGLAYVGGTISARDAQFGTISAGRAAETGYVAALGGLPLASRPMAVEPLALEVYPNPATSGTVTLSYSLIRPESVKLTVLDALGREVLNVSGEELSGPRMVVLQTRRLAVGVYVVRAQVGKRVSFRRLVVE